jgi:hypothetical protein
MGFQRVPPSRGSPGETVCFKCRQKGHYKANCNDACIKPVPKSTIFGNESSIVALFDLFRAALVANTASCACNGGVLRDVSVSPSWSDIVKSFAPSDMPSAARRASRPCQDPRAKTACAGCAKLHSRMEELVGEVNQLKTELQTVKASSAKSGMNPAAASWKQQDYKCPASSVDQKCVAEPARSEKQAGSALETGTSPVKSESVTRSSPVVSARSLNESTSGASTNGGVAKFAAQSNVAAAPVAGLERKPTTQQPVVTLEQKSSEIAVQPPAAGQADVKSPTATGAPQPAEWKSSGKKKKKSKKERVAERAARPAGADGAVPAEHAAVKPGSVGADEKEARKLFDEKHRWVLWMVNTLKQPEYYQMDEHSEMGGAVLKLRELAKKWSFKCRCVQCPVWWDENLAHKKWEEAKAAVKADMKARRR